MRAVAFINPTTKFSTARKRPNVPWLIKQYKCKICGISKLDTFQFYTFSLDSNNNLFVCFGCLYFFGGYDSSGRIFIWKWNWKKRKYDVHVTWNIGICLSVHPKKKTHNLIKINKFNLYVQHVFQEFPYIEYIWPHGI